MDGERDTGKNITSNEAAIWISAELTISGIDDNLTESIRVLFQWELHFTGYSSIANQKRS